MKSSELFPFSRNRYYKGKMLTSADFEAEQIYMNNKRRFINQVISGSGIVCGLNVISLDDLSLMVESGVAIDDAGREIVVENSVVKKLSAITGFEGLTTNQASLCIRYKESETQPVYTINRKEGESEYEYNRIEEGYELFLQDTSTLNREFEVESEFFTGGVLFENQDYRVTLKLPANICTGHYVRLSVEVEKLSKEKANLYYECILQTPALSTLDGERELKVLLENIMLEQGKKITKEFWMLAQDEEMPDTSVMFKTGSGKALVNGVETVIGSGPNCKINIVNEDAETLATREIGRISMEFRNMGGGTGVIVLANLLLVRTESAYLIESVDEKSVKRYIPTIRDESQRREYSAYFSKKLPFYEKSAGFGYGAQAKADIGNLDFGSPRIETGIVEIPLGENAKKGDICYSGEIMHGLGKGNVYVEVGYEYLEEDPVLGRNAKTTVYGNPDLFRTEGTSVAAETAVKVLNDKGSFIVALKLLQDVRMLVLTYRWVAIRYDGEELKEEAELDFGKSISAVTPTIVVKSKESYFFQVKFNNMKPCSISYELTEVGSGEITPDGVYTAPAKEGVYEIKIYCTEKPLICTYAYAIVKKQTKEDAAE